MAMVRVRWSSCQGIAVKEIAARGCYLFLVCYFLNRAFLGGWANLDPRILLGGGNP